MGIRTLINIHIYGISGAYRWKIMEHHRTCFDRGTVKKALPPSHTPSSSIRPAMVDGPNRNSPPT
jgi:hypothetical protein